jgi:phage I-like protein
METTILPPQKQTPHDTIALFPVGITEPRSFDTRGPWKLSDPVSVIEKSMLDGELLIDYEHQSSHSSQNGQPAPAAGWIIAMRFSMPCEQSEHNNKWCQHFPQGVILADVVWTDKARDMIANGEYRFISPSFLTQNNGEISQIISAALVNQPAITTLPPLNKKSEHDASSHSFTSNLKRCLRLQAPPPSLCTLTVNLPSQKNEKINVHDVVSHALKKGQITPAQRHWAEICAEKAGKEFSQFLAVAPTHAQHKISSASAQSLSEQSHSNHLERAPSKTLVSPLHPDNDVIRTLGINPQLYAQLQQKEISS